MLLPVVAFALLCGASLAQRPANASLCDYYAQQKYGANTSESQYQLVQGIVALAFGGAGNFSNGSAADITGILNPGVFQNTSVRLEPWFNGALASTNLNDQGVGIDWLDDGARVPLYQYLNGITANVILGNATNEYRLFGHFFYVFSRMFGCTVPAPAPPSPGGPVSLAYVHKFMNLNYTDLGYFIDQLTRSTTFYGFSQQDALTLNTQMNSLYNVRCLPAVTLNQAQGPQLLSLCQASSCPLAVPVSDCAAYVNLTANGIQSSAPTSVASAATSQSASAAASSTLPPPAATTAVSASPSSPATPAPTSSSSTLSSGAIAGIAIGGSALLLLFIALMFWIRRKKRPPTPTPPPMDHHSYPHSPISPYPSPYHPSAKGSHASYASHGPAAVVEIDSPPGPLSPQPGGISHHHRYTYSPETGNRIVSGGPGVSPDQNPVEMGTPEQRWQQQQQEQHQQHWGEGGRG